MTIYIGAFRRKEINLIISDFLAYSWKAGDGLTTDLFCKV
jgi:hypothetical protein